MVEILDNFKQQVEKNCKGRFSENESLSRHTTWRVGGPAQYFYRPVDLDDLARFMRLIPEDLPITWLGLGSNVLIRDGGIDGIVIAHQGSLRQFSPLDETTVRAEVGLACAQVARFAARLDLQGAEFLAGVPGTIGGALALNAGCYGSETWDFITAAETINRQGEITLRPASDFDYQYRFVKQPDDEWFVAGHFKLTAGTKDVSLEKIKDLLDRRAHAQPTGKPCAGSVFRNPPGDFSARLIEQCGLKGFAIGGAEVSDKHANFIISSPHTSAQDIEQLIQHVGEAVEAKFGIKLIPEVHIMGRSESL